jgi:hypothetical protein
MFDGSLNTSYAASMAKPTIVACPHRGAVYERRMEKLHVRDQDSFESTCGHTPERWSSSAFPVFRSKTRRLPPTSERTTSKNC